MTTASGPRSASRSDDSNIEVLSNRPWAGRPSLSTDFPLSRSDLCTVRYGVRCSFEREAKRACCGEESRRRDDASNENPAVRFNNLRVLRPAFFFASSWLWAALGFPGWARQARVLKATRVFQAETRRRPVTGVISAETIPTQGDGATPRRRGCSVGSRRQAETRSSFPLRLQSGPVAALRRPIFLEGTRRRLARPGGLFLAFFLALLIRCHLFRRPRRHLHRH